MIKILSSLREIVEGSLYEKPDIKIMPEESERSDSRNDIKGDNLKALTPSQMLSRLQQISLAQLKAGNN